MGIPEFSLVMNKLHHPTMESKFSEKNAIKSMALHTVHFRYSGTRAPFRCVFSRRVHLECATCVADTPCCWTRRWARRGRSHGRFAYVPPLRHLALYFHFCALFIYPPYMAWTYMSTVSLRGGGEWTSPGWEGICICSVGERVFSTKMAKRALCKFRFCAFFYYTFSAEGVWLSAQGGVAPPMPFYALRPTILGGSSNQ